MKPTSTHTIPETTSDTNPIIAQVGGWSCHKCGHCCQSYDLGPVKPSTISTLENAGAAAFATTNQDGGWYHRRQAADGTEALFLNRPNGRCTFLEPDNLCAIFNHLGPELRPIFCQSFPFHATELEGKIAVTVRESCASWHKSVGSSSPIKEAIPTQMPRLHETPGGITTLTGRNAGLHGNKGVGSAAWARLEPALRSAVSDHLQPAQMVGSVLDELARWADLDLPEPDTAKAEQAKAALVSAIIKLLTTATQSADASIDSSKVQFITESAVWFNSLAPHLSTSAKFTPQASVFAATTLRGRLLSGEVLTLGGLTDGLGFWLFATALAKAAARTELIEASQLADGMVRLNTLRGISAFGQFLRHAKPALADLAVYGRSEEMRRPK